MKLSPRNKADLINYFLRHKVEEQDAHKLDLKLSKVLQFPLNSKELSIVLYYAASHAVQEKAYGNEKIAKGVIGKHIQAWTDQAINYGGLYNDATLSYMMSGFRILRVRPPERFTKFAEAKAISLMPEYGSDEIVSTLAAIARLGLYFDKKFYEDMQIRVPQIKDSFTPKNCYRFLHQLAVIDSVNEKMDGDARAPLHKIFIDFFNDPDTQEKLKQIDEASYRGMRLDATSWFNVRDDKMSYPDQEEEWSAFEVDAANAFKKAGAKLLPAITVPGTKHELDLSAEFKNAVFHVECDGPTHFVHSADDHKVFLDGNTILQTGLINKRMPKQILVRMPYDAFYQNEGNRKIAEDLLWRLSQVQFGSYLIDGGWNLTKLTSGYQAEIPFSARQTPYSRTLE